MRYRTGDVYKCLSLNDIENNNNLPRFEYVDRVPWIIDIAGFSRFNEEEITNVINKSNVKVNDWYATKALTLDNKPILNLYLEVDEVDEKIFSKLDEAFTLIDEDYEGLKKILGTNPLKVTFLKNKTIQEYKISNANFMRVNSMEDIK